MTLQTYPRLIAIVGRPNVGKSTLFNRIIRSRKSLVHDEPGVTRDRIFGKAEHDGINFFLCDTGGFEPTSKDNIKIQLVDQAKLAIEEAEVVIFVVDAREGIHPIDGELIRELRKANKEFTVAVNKCDTPAVDYLAEDFRKLGVDRLFPVSAEHSRGVGDLLDNVLTKVQSKQLVKDHSDDAIKLAIIGRPNVGKSSILNRLVGEERSIVDPRPGTTRDTVDVVVKYHGREIVLLDTAGIRRKSRMVDKMEKFSAFRSVMNIENADVAILVIDAEEGPTEGDARVAGFAFEQRKPILIVVNKWDLIKEKTTGTAEEYTEKVRSALQYIPYAPVMYVSALENLRVSKLLPTALELYDEGNKKISTSNVNKVLKEILEKHTPPVSKQRARRMKFFYSTQIGRLPPRFLIFCTDPQELHFSYKRFIENKFKEAFDFKHIPISVVFRERSRNEYFDDNRVNKPSRSLSGKNSSPDLLDIDLDEDVELEFAEHE